MDLTSVLVAGLVIGIGVASWSAMRATARRRAVELELVSARAALAQLESDRRSSFEALSSTRVSLARLETERGIVGRRVDQLEAEVIEARETVRERAAMEAELDGLRAQSVLARDVQERLEAHVELAARREAELRAAMQHRASLEAQLAELPGLRARIDQLTQALARADAQLEGAASREAERAQAAERDRETLRLELTQLTERLLEDKGRAMLDQSHRGLETLLEPVRERLRDFEAKVQHTYDTETRDRAALLERLKGLQEAQQRLHSDALSLTRVLTGDSRAQGEWGELVLESLLSTAGLTEGREYELQLDHRDAEGAHRRPDAVVFLPPDRAIVIDSKCSLTAFAASSRAASDDERELDLAAHVHSVRTHVRSLAAKDYQSVLKERTLDIVLMFMPSEAAFHAALSRDPALYEDAFRQRIVLCSPTTLLAALQVVSHVWRSERQTLNAQRIADEAGRMIDKLSSALESFDELGERLGRAQAAFDHARGRLATGRGNVVQIATRVVELGARVTRPEKLENVRARLDAEPEADQRPRQLELATTEGESGARGDDGDRRGRDHSGDRRRVDSDADDEAVPRGEGPAPSGAALLSAR